MKGEPNVLELRFWSCVKADKILLKQSCSELFNRIFPILVHLSLRKSKITSLSNMIFTVSIKLEY
ncbi:hypothetical protein BpHYR1_006287 [Brachionus plicatilis]|uniref:Uncharacterized protein n=1 Tax=Brachionus plicatilis TaxID=10195 RepID=A0A3M7RAB9_BRAPC|nr:hypothetical protein BpHYR1_006287 [Brachionus plicatilis]